jgi:hypothetical protein
MGQRLREQSVAEQARHMQTGEPPRGKTVVKPDWNEEAQIGFLVVHG